MERDMGTTLATKQDLALLLDQKFDTLRGDVSRDLAALDLRMTVKLGSMIFVGFGATIAALRLWL